MGWFIFSLAIAFSQVFLVFSIPVTKSPVISIDDVEFQLYTRSNPDQGARVIIGDALSLIAAGYVGGIPNKIIIHGWMDKVSNNVIQTPKKAFLDLEPMNVFGVGWSACSKNILYEEAVECAKQVGAYSGELVQWLINDFGASLDQFHGIGHSLGAQAISFMSTDLKMPRLTGLDPAGPLFSHADADNRLDSGDADFVDVIHSSIGFLGIEDHIGHSDFYPNGGSNQPGCDQGLFGGCSHSAAYYFYSFTVAEENRNKYLCSLCDSVESARNQSCPTEPITPMGYGADPNSDEFVGKYSRDSWIMPLPCCGSGVAIKVNATNPQRHVEWCVLCSNSRDPPL